MMSMICLLGSVALQLAGNGQDVQLAIAPLVVAAAISAAASIGSSIFGSVSAKKEKKARLKAIAEAQKENRDWYNRRYYEDATQRADAQRMLTRTNDAIKKRTKAAYGRKAVVGGTDASLASTQQANAEAIGNAMGDIVANAEARKDDIEQQYRERQQSLEAQKSDVNTAYSQAQRQNVATAAQGVANAAASIVGSSGSSGSSSSTGATRVSGSNGTTTPAAARAASLKRTESLLDRYGGIVGRRYSW